MRLTRYFPTRTKKPGMISLGTREWVELGVIHLVGDIRIMTPASLADSKIYLIYLAEDSAVLPLGNSLPRGRTFILKFQYQKKIWASKRFTNLKHLINVKPAAAQESSQGQKE